MLNGWESPYQSIKKAWMNMPIGAMIRARLEDRLTVAVKGGGGSGNWGHAGRPGKRGGSAIGGGLNRIGVGGRSTREERIAGANEYRAIGETISGFNSNLSAVDRKRVVKNLQGILRIGRDRDTEVGIAYDSSGHVIENPVIGDRGSIEFTLDQLQSASVIAHTHPNGTSFSGEDIGLLYTRPNIQSVIAIGHNGTLYRVSKTPESRKRARDVLRPQEDRVLKQHNGNMFGWEATSKAIVMMQDDALAKDWLHYAQKVQNKELTPGQASYEHIHKANIALTDKLGLDYERIEP